MEILTITSMDCKIKIFFLSVTIRSYLFDSKDGRWKNANNRSSILKLHHYTGTTTQVGRPLSSLLIFAIVDPMVCDGW
jgi:hypothetical protein